MLLSDTIVRAMEDRAEVAPMSRTPPFYFFGKRYTDNLLFPGTRLQASNDETTQYSPGEALGMLYIARAKCNEASASLTREQLEACTERVSDPATLIAEPLSESR